MLDLRKDYLKLITIIFKSFTNNVLIERLQKRKTILVVFQNLN